MQFQPGTGYQMSTPFDQGNLGIANDSMGGYQSYANNFWKNPTQMASMTEDRLRSMLYPQFDSVYNDTYGDAIAGLGNRYGSTFGALTAADTAGKLARAKAGLDLDIYQAGQEQVDTEINRLGQLGNLTSLDQARLTQNYAPIIGGLTAAENVRQGSNNAANQQYNAQVNQYSAQLRQPTFFDRAIQVAALLKK